MDRTPLLDCFRRGDVPRDIRMLAARGALAPRAHEQLALLVFLIGDADPTIAQAAAQTIEALPAQAVARFIGRPDVNDELRGFFIARGIHPIVTTGLADESDEPLVETELDAPDQAPAAARASATPEDERELKVLNALPVPVRLKLALRGTREQRAMLIRDTNKIIAAAVLSSPKLSETEVETFARMTNVSDDVLRTIGTSRIWTRSYAISSALVRNPKTPPAISLTLLPRLNDRDIRMLSLDRNLPEALRMALRKIMVVNLSRKR